jgi:hypothetical protein
MLRTTDSFVPAFVYITGYERRSKPHAAGIRVAQRALRAPLLRRENPSPLQLLPAAGVDAVALNDGRGCTERHGGLRRAFAIRSFVWIVRGRYAVVRIRRLPLARADARVASTLSSRLLTLSLPFRMLRT